tara:strand:- start:2058 stop:3197 length:1140 start_codon:yes stop_codon:yes gene_type:complete
MPTTKIDSSDVTNFSQKQYSNTAAYQDKSKYPSSYSVTAAGDTTETEYQNTNWTTQHGAYLEVSELAGMIDRKAQYIVGKGFKVKGLLTGKKKKLLENIKGNGLDTFNTIMYNNVRCYTIGGDSFNEIIRNSRGELVNLKPLNPSTVKIHADDKGMIKSYEVFPIRSNPLGTSENASVTFQPNEIFHLAYNRVADQIHGQSVMDKLMPIIEMRGEAMRDLRVVFHRYVKPLLISSVDTDDTAEITSYKNKLDEAMEKGENMVVPKGVVDNIEKISIPQFSTLDPLPWLKLLQDEFLKAEGVPRVVLAIGEAGSDAESKIMYLSWQQIVEFNQMFVEEQTKAQLGIEVEFEFPADITPGLVEENKKGKSPSNVDVQATKK